MHHPKYALFYDFHTSSDYLEVGRDFNVKELTDYLMTCEMDYLTFHARCNKDSKNKKMYYGVVSLLLLSGEYPVLRL